MTTPWPARFTDAHGVELTSIEIDHESILRMRIRGFDFVGQPDGFDAAVPLPPDAPFTLDWQGAVSHYTLEWRAPVAVDRRGGAPLAGLLYVRLGAEDGLIAVVLRVGGAEYRSHRLQDRLDEALMDLRSALPEGLRLRMCHSCGLAEYPDDAYFAFGDLICFRDTPDLIRNHRGRLDALMPRQAGFVPETHLCSRFEPGGYRGTVGHGEPNTWSVEDWAAGGTAVQ